MVGLGAQTFEACGQRFVAALDKAVGIQQERLGTIKRHHLGPKSMQSTRCKRRISPTVLREERVAGLEDKRRDVTGGNEPELQEIGIDDPKEQGDHASNVQGLYQAVQPRNDVGWVSPSTAHTRSALRSRPMATAASTPWPATSPIASATAPDGNASTSYQSPPMPAAGWYFEVKRRPGTRGMLTGRNVFGARPSIAARARTAVRSSPERPARPPSAEAARRAR